jgi:exonuclease VII small subunit
MIEGNEEKKVVVEDGQVVFTPDTKADKADNAKKAEQKKDLSEIFTDLDSLLQKMEGEESLEKSFAIYEKAVALLNEANSSIDRIEKQVRILDGEEGK